MKSKPRHNANPKKFMGRYTARNPVRKMTREETARQRKQQQYAARLLLETTGFTVLAPHYSPPVYRETIVLDERDGSQLVFRPQFEPPSDSSPDVDYLIGMLDTFGPNHCATQNLISPAHAAQINSNTFLG